MCLDQMLYSLVKILKATINFKIHQNLFKYCFKLWHFALDDPVMYIVHHGTTFVNRSIIKKNAQTFFIRRAWTKCTITFFFAPTLHQSKYHKKSYDNIYITVLKYNPTYYSSKVTNPKKKDKILLFLNSLLQYFQYLNCILTQN